MSNARPSVRDGYEDADPTPVPFWWEFDRCDATREIRALARRMGVDVRCLTNDQIVEFVWEVAGR